MSNDDRTFGTMLALVVGGGAGYAAGRWLVEPWLATRFGRSGTTPANVLGPVTPPSGAMQPLDPYGNVPSPPVAAAPSVVAPTRPAATAPTNGPITSPSQVVAPARTDGPITSPTQVAITVPARPAVTPPSGTFATSAGVRRFDPIFERYRGTLPLAYVRALVERESDGRPDMRTGSAVGLMQVVPVVLADYNKRHGTAYSNAQLVDPATNVAIACELLRTIVDSYRKNHPRTPNLQPNWSNPRFVELLTFGWNAGFSEAGGVGRVVRYLENLGAVDITLDLVAAHAKGAGASSHLSNSAKVSWCKSVVALYQRELALTNAPTTLAAP